MQFAQGSQLTSKLGGVRKKDEKVSVSESHIEK